MRRDEICIRDPYVVLLGDVYYMYGTDGYLTFSGKPARGFPTVYQPGFGELGGPSISFPSLRPFLGKNRFLGAGDASISGKLLSFCQLHRPR